jgi:hypothetical protein
MANSAMTFFVKRNSGANRPLLISGKSWNSLAHWASGAKQPVLYLSDHGFVQSEKESFAETMARVLGINTDKLRVCIAENRIGSALLKTLPILRLNRRTLVDFTRSTAATSARFLGADLPLFSESIVLIDFSLAAFCGRHVDHFRFRETASTIYGRLPR